MKKERHDIGQLIRELRKAKDLSQMALAEKIGVSYQQIQKYEKGVDNLNVPRLRQMAEALEVPVTFFFVASTEGVAEAPAHYGKMSEEEQLVLRLFRSIKDKKLRLAALDFLKALAKQG